MGLVTPYCGQDQQSAINVPATIAYREAEREEGCWVLPSYQAIFPEVPNEQTGAGVAMVPPPVQKTDIFAAQQTWPL